MLSMLNGLKACLDDVAPSESLLERLRRGVIVFVGQTTEEALKASNPQGEKW